MPWLWTDTLAALLIEHDGIAPAALDGWRRNPVGHRLGDGQDPLALARALLAREPPQPPDATEAAAVGGDPQTAAAVR
jgi:hypothetical protein